MGATIGTERSCFSKPRTRTSNLEGDFSMKRMDVRDEFGKWNLAEVTKVQAKKHKVHIHFVGWDQKWDLILDVMKDHDRFSSPGKFSAIRERCEFKQSEYVLIMRRKPRQAKGVWIQGFVRLVDGPQVQVQYTYRGITFQYWYHYHQAEIHPIKDSERWMNLKSSDRVDDLPDGVSGLFGKEVMYLLFSRNSKKLKRVGAHADGTCFFHAVFHSLDAQDPDSESSRDETKNVTYRKLTSAQRLRKGRQWRKALKHHVEKEWFKENLANVCDWDTFIKQYDDVTYSTGPTHNMHVAAFFKVNIFFVSFYTHPDTNSRDFFVRISSPDGAAQYNKERPSIVLFHRAHGDQGHYESIQTDEEEEPFGQGVFEHSDALIQHLLSKANTLL
mmetsp:Transcript_31482/g.76821  ORF Transcript_31482/g.76821 Transcript_31482/m.76821 type:complete len:386 (+) Transcript_31482:265-1422(+)